MSSNEVGLFLEPDWKRVNRVFLKKWRKHVPKELYTINKGEQCITFITGSKLYYGPRNITGSVESSEDSQLGQDTTFVIDDEAALKCNSMFYSNTLATVREPSDFRFYLLLSTPRIGAFQDLVESGQQTLFTGTSYDNPYTPADYVDTMIANMSTLQVERDIYGRFMALDGRIWDDAILDDTSDGWPASNRDDIHTEFDDQLPWYLFCDIGSATGAYAVVQPVDGTFLGREVFGGPRWVAVADYCPMSSANVRRAFRRLRVEFGIPAGIVAGADIDRESDTDGKTPAYFAQKIFGSVPIYPCSERIYNKQNQADVMGWLFRDAAGKRRFTVARNFVSLDEDSKRGIREMIHQDVWLDESKRRACDVLPKNREVRVQHIRDALLMGAAMIMKPPTWLPDEEEFD
jgi:hypothetical protein